MVPILKEIIFFTKFSYADRTSEPGLNLLSIARRSNHYTIGTCWIVGYINLFLVGYIGYIVSYMQIEYIYKLLYIIINMLKFQIYLVYT